MYQALIRNGKIQSVEVPNPTVSPGSLLIQTVCSCISAGTEASMIEASKPKSLIRSAMNQPEKVRKALQNFKEKGFVDTFNKISQVKDSEKKQQSFPKPVGYSLAGFVIAVGDSVNGFKIGDRVAASGAGVASHAEYVDVPVNLVTRIPDGLSFQSASTVTLGGIAMQGVRRADVQLGEYIVIYGTGILGLLALQLAKAAGGRCLAVDLNDDRLSIAKTLGAEFTINPQKEDLAHSIFHYTGGHNADTVIFTAATSNPDVLSDALAITRKKGRLVMVGVYGNQVNRQDLYRKEIDFLVSTSYGPGRYDDIYEYNGIDYPYAYVRWTENRNLQEFLRLLSENEITIDPMIGNTYPIQEVDKAFAELNKPDRQLLIFLQYGDLTEDRVEDDYQPGRITLSAKNTKDDLLRVGIIGAGSFAVNMHLPNLQMLSDKYDIRAICSKTGSKAKTIAERFTADYATTDYQEILNDPDIDLAIICTRHNLHGNIAMESLLAGKHTFVEKPLCLTLEELRAFQKFYGFHEGVACSSAYKPGSTNGKPLLMVGFNRRYSKYAKEIKKHTDKRINPLLLHYRMNAGYIPLDHWVHSDEGGGRIVGEACHIIDLFNYIVGFPVNKFSCSSLQPNTDSVSSSDNKIITLEYKDGSIGTIHYFAVGSREVSKEWMEAHFDGKSIFMDDYHTIKGFGLNVKALSSNRPDKGHLDILNQLQYNIHYMQFSDATLLELLDSTKISLYCQYML